VERLKEVLEATAERLAMAKTNDGEVRQRRGEGQRGVEAALVIFYLA
jgi:hypothetical protein